MSGKERKEMTSNSRLSAYTCDICRVINENQESVGQLHEVRGSQRWKCPDREAQLWGSIQLVPPSLRASEDCWVTQPLSQPGQGTVHVCSSEPGESPGLQSQQVKDYTVTCVLHVF